MKRPLALLLLWLVPLIAACQAATPTPEPLTSKPTPTVNAAQPGEGDAAMLELFVNLDKTAYRAGEPMTATFGLKNAGADPVIVNGRLLVNQSFALPALRDVVLVIVSPSGKTNEYRFIVHGRLPKAEDFVALAAGETVEKRMDISGKYVFTETGEYTLQAVYQNGSDPGDGRTAWQGELKSNEVKFTLEP